MKQATDQDLQLGKWLGGAALGAVVMYMLDPERGAPRRALSREKLRQLGRQTGQAIDKVVQEVGSSVSQAASSIRDSADVASDNYQESNADDTRAQRHARALGSYPKTGGTDNIHDTRETRSTRERESSRSHRVEGMLRQGAQTIRRALSSAPTSEYGRTDALTLGATDHSSNGEPQRDASRRGVTLAGATILGLGSLMAPRTPLGMAMGLAGLALLLRASGRHPVRAVLSRASHAPPVEVEKTIRIDAAPGQVFDMFANYENFPRFMSNVVEVRDLGERRSHWVVKGPAGSQFAWNAVLTEHDRPHYLAWESEAGAEVEQSGSIQFEPIHSGTRVTVRMSYRPPAGAVGQALASLLGRDPKRQMDEDLVRMKSLVERGARTQFGATHSVADGKFLH